MMVIVELPVVDEQSIKKALYNHMQVQLTKLEYKSLTQEFRTWLSQNGYVLRGLNTGDLLIQKTVA